MAESTEMFPARLRGRRAHREWREGGASVARWDAELLGWSVAALGVGVLGARLGALVLPSALAQIVCPALLWVAFLIPAVGAFARSSPRGLVRLRGVDIAIALVWGLLLRLAQGSLAAAAGESAWPAAVDLRSLAFLTEAVVAVVVAPVLEELFFRGVLLVCIYTVVRRLSGRAAAVLASLLVTTVLFVAAHGLVAPLAPADTASLALVGAITATCVLATGRLWPAILVHAMYNLTGIAVVVVASTAA